MEGDAAQVEEGAIARIQHIPEGGCERRGARCSPEISVEVSGERLAKESTDKEEAKDSESMTNLLRTCNGGVAEKDIIDMLAWKWVALKEKIMSKERKSRDKLPE